MTTMVCAMCSIMRVYCTSTRETAEQTVVKGSQASGIIYCTTINTVHVLLWEPRERADIHVAFDFTAGETNLKRCSRRKAAATASPNKREE